MQMLTNLLLLSSKFFILFFAPLFIDLHMHIITLFLSLFSSTSLCTLLAISILQHACVLCDNKVACTSYFITLFQVFMLFSTYSKPFSLISLHTSPRFFLSFFHLHPYAH